MKIMKIILFAFKTKNKKFVSCLIVINLIKFRQKIKHMSVYFKI